MCLIVNGYERRYLMKKMIIIFIGILLISLTSCQYKEKEIRLSSGAVGGTYYPIGGAIAQLLSDYVEGYFFTSYEGNEQVANTELINKHDIETALIQSNVAYLAYTGEGPFVGREVKNLRGIASLYSEVVHIIVAKNSDIQNVYDLKGKKINIGKSESGTCMDALSVLKACEIMEYEAYEYVFSDAYIAMEAGELDCIFITAGYPTETVTRLMNQLDAKLLTIPKEVINSIITEQKYYADATIPTGVYTGNDEINTLAARALWVCDANVSELLVYEMTKVLWENTDIIAKAHDQGKEISIVNALEGMGIPLHEGAYQYYEEIGLEELDGE